MQSKSNIVSKVDSEILDICLEALEEVKAAYFEAQQKQKRIVELEKVAAEAPKIDAALVDQTIRNLVASSCLEADHSEKLASELKKDPAVALRLVQRFIELICAILMDGREFYLKVHKPPNPDK